MESSSPRLPFSLKTEERVELLNCLDAIRIQNRNGIQVGQYSGKVYGLSDRRFATSHVPDHLKTMSSGLPSLPESMQGSFNLESCTEKDFVGALETCLHSLIEEFIVDTKNKYALPQDALDRLRKMFVYNCLGGKYWRAQQVMITVRVLGNSGKSKYSTADLSMASLVLGWCIEAVRLQHVQCV